MYNRMSRKAAREMAFHAIYEYSFNARRLADICTQKTDYETGHDLAGFVRAYKKPLEPQHEQYLKDILENIEQRLPEIDALIEKYANNWNLGRISRVTMAILRLSIFELLCRLDIPPKVSVNEAVDMAKKYDTDEAPQFINGILASVIANEAAERMSIYDPTDEEPDDEEEDIDEPETSDE